MEDKFAALHNLIEDSIPDEDGFLRAGNVYQIIGPKLSIEGTLLWVEDCGVVVKLSKWIKGMPKEIKAYAGSRVLVMWDEISAVLDPADRSGDVSLH